MCFTRPTAPGKTRQLICRKGEVLHKPTSLPGLIAGNSLKEILLSSQGWPVIAKVIRTGSAGPAMSKYVRVKDDGDDAVVGAMMMWC